MVSIESRANFDGFLWSNESNSHNSFNISTMIYIISFSSLPFREYLATFKKTVAMHEVFLQRIAGHPTMRNDHNFRVFLGMTNGAIIGLLLLLSIALFTGHSVARFVRSLASLTPLTY